MARRKFELMSSGKLLATKKEETLQTYIYQLMFGK